ncbi:hypothetical protein PNOK_0200300 [Pyrrhoderma noxium]|uniref:Zn(2)-C6 fungal-type domain-containing protein n=1 Tax=Pyrrhoderma noxium TaxID=2282107 RepID=A0A286UR23_9AGAM|nr:hypothetical protein PNOK_0200300 [Pyrrhoderma noxium]
MSIPSSTEYPDNDPFDSNQLCKKRSSRACDQCRRTKSKCRRPTGSDRPCSNCIIAGLMCTFQGPSFKRGPPKGYINAIEQRLHQVEALLSAIVSSGDTRAQGVISDLRKDATACEIIDRVDRGPYGSSSRITAETRPADFANAIRQLSESDSKSSRSVRDSRMNRENVSLSSTEIPAPSLRWLQKLKGLIEGQGLSHTPDQWNIRNRSASSTINIREPVVKMGSRSSSVSENEEDLIERAEDEEAIGNLSVNENQEFRYHNEASGMPLLDRLTDSAGRRNSDGIWRLPVTRIWSFAPVQLSGLDSESSVAINMPSIEHQDLLIELYFTYVHPELPVLNKSSFLSLYATSKFPSGSENTRTYISKLLLLSMFTISGRYNPREQPFPSRSDQMWEAGCNYLASARRILYSVLHKTSITTCQSLILLAYREFGVGSFEHGSFFIGMAIRMAQDLGLHRSADKWQRFGTDLLSQEQKLERKRVWWSCCIVEKYIACSLGCPVAIHENEYDTDLPEDNATVTSTLTFTEETDLWQPHPIIATSKPLGPIVGHVFSSFRAVASLSIIVGKIIIKIYSIRQKPWNKKQQLLFELDKQLNDWLLHLPHHLQYDLCLRQPASPQIILLHIQYSHAVLLLHRRFIPRLNHKESAASAHGIDTTREFSLCQGAARKITELASAIEEIFSLGAASAYLPTYLMSAGIVHLAGLAIGPDKRGSDAALKKTMACLKGMERIWPSAQRNHELLESSREKFQSPSSNVVLVGHTSPQGGLSSYSYVGENTEDRNANALLMAHLLGLNVPEVEASQTQVGSLPIYSTERNSTSQLETTLSPLSQTSQFHVPMDFGQMAHSYPDYGPFYGYDFQSFTESDSNH